MKPTAHQTHIHESLYFILFWAEKTNPTLAALQNQFDKILSTVNRRYFFGFFQFKHESSLFSCAVGTTETDLHHYFYRIIYYKTDQQLI